MAYIDYLGFWGKGRIGLKIVKALRPGIKLVAPPPPQTPSTSQDRWRQWFRAARLSLQYPATDARTAWLGRRKRATYQWDSSPQRRLLYIANVLTGETAVEYIDDGWVYYATINTMLDITWGLISYDWYDNGTWRYARYERSYAGFHDGKLRDLVVYSDGTWHGVDWLPPIRATLYTDAEPREMEVGPWDFAPTVANQSVPWESWPW